MKVMHKIILEREDGSEEVFSGEAFCIAVLNGNTECTVEYAGSDTEFKYLFRAISNELMAMRGQVKHV